MKDSLKTSNVLKLISYLQVGSLWVLLVVIPFRIGPFSRWAMIAAGMFFFIDYSANQRWRTWSWHRNKWLYVAMIAYYMFIPLWQLGSDTYNQQRFFYVLETHAPLLLGGIIGIIGFSEIVKLRHIAYVMLASCLFTSLYIIFRSYGPAFFAHWPNEQADMFMLARIHWVNSHMVYNLYLNVSLIFAIYLLRQKNVKRPVKICVITVCAWIFYLLCLTEGRIGLFTGLLIGATFLLTYTYSFGLKWFITCVLIYVSAVTLIISQHKRFASDYMEHEPRLVIWHAAIEVIKEKPLTGHGVCGAKERLTEKALVGEGDFQDFYRPYINDKTIYRLPHPHNAFLQAWSDFGIIGLATLMFIFIFPLTMQPKKHRMYVLMTVGCFVIQSMTDLFFTLQPLLYILVIIFFTTEQHCKPTEPEQETETEANHVRCGA